MKKLLRLLSIALTVILIGSTLVTSAFGSQVISENVLLSKQDDANMVVNQIRPKVVKDESNLSKNIQFNNTYASEYGGAYIDEEGTLNVNIVGDGQNIKKLIESANTKAININYHSIKYSLQNLKDMDNSLCDRLVELGIKALEVDEKNNKLIIYLKDLQDTQKIQNIKKIIDSPAIEYQKMEGEIVTSVALNVVNGTAANTTEVIQGFTMGVGATRNGVKGWIIPGHLTDGVGKDISYQDWLIGTIQAKDFGGSVDAGFAARKTSGGPYNIVNYFYNGDYYDSWDSYNYSSGTTITFYGAASKKQSGYILDNDFTFTPGDHPDVTLKHVVKASYLAALGDSGGPVTYYHATNSSRSVIGIQSCISTSPQYSVYTTIYDIEQALGVSPCSS
ncbi:MAG: hypothetical protein P4L49_14165 [Desulfosporosinus sp.]|nr:hypothetical protein [Desulfosporosinus sp.]